MKKYVALSLLLTVLFSLTSCIDKYKGPMSSVSHIQTDGNTSSTELTEENEQKILDILNDGEWVDDGNNCGYDYEFTVKNKKILYHSQCGTFAESGKGISLSLSEEDKIEVNKLLGVVEKVVLESVENMQVDIIDKIYPDILVAETNYKGDIEEFGETVYVITDNIDEWCVGDEVIIVFSEVGRPADTTQPVRVMADKIHIPNYYGKPIIYLYPEEKTVCSVKVEFDGELTCTYPEHSADGWQNFVAHPDGTLVFPDGKEYYALYWEGINDVEWDMTKGFCVRGEDTAEFLEWALAEQGLTRREANEFIVYWLPLMQENPYNVISFQTTAYTDEVKLDITPTPDSLLRVYMTYYASDREVEIQPQSFENFERQGFTVVEWGGSIIEKP
ncbi:MAG: hypothetical protein E7642_06140 [Ruminococcaceae bacterium]|nr:hypothetical protein [Oscillospiraceae bacterium]